MQVFALELLEYQEWLNNQNANPRIAEMKQQLGLGGYADDDLVDAEDLSAVEWKAPSDLGEEEVMNDLEAFNRAMANSHVTLADGDGGWI